MISGWGIVGWIIHRLPNSWRAKQRCLNILASKPINSIHISWITSSLYHGHVSYSKTDARGEDFTMGWVIQKMLLFAQNNWLCLLWSSQFVYELFGQECEMLRVMMGCHDRALSRVTRIMSRPSITSSAINIIARSVFQVRTDQQHNMQPPEVHRHFVKIPHHFWEIITRKCAVIECVRSK